MRHSTLRKEKTMKKSLIALAIAGVLSALAGVIFRHVVAE